MKNLIALREAKKITQKEMAQYLGVTRQCYQRYEAGQREPDFSTLKKLADYFNSSLDYLLGIAPEPTDEEKALGMTRTAPIALSDKDKRRLTMLMEADEVLGEERVDMALSLIELSVEAEKNKS